jgi:hypothetical protein
MDSSRAFQCTFYVDGVKVQFVSFAQSRHELGEDAWYRQLEEDAVCKKLEQERGTYGQRI